MGQFLDFQALKDSVSFGDAVTLLNLNLKKAGNQWRGPCPACEAGGDRALVVTEGRGFYCWAKRAGGDQIALAAHVLGIPAKEAAHELATRAGIVQVPERNSTSTRKGTVPESEAGKRGLAPLSYLEHAHDAVIALGFDPGWCEHHGVGYAPRGVCRGSVAIPFRDEAGVLLGYIGVEDITYLPTDFTANVVPFAKRA